MLTLCANLHQVGLLIIGNATITRRAIISAKTVVFKEVCEEHCAVVVNTLFVETSETQYYAQRVHSFSNSVEQDSYYVVCVVYE